LRVSYVDGYVAFSPMPSQDEIPELTRIFDTIIALVEDWELQYKPPPAQAGFMRIPIPESTIPPLHVVHGITSHILAPNTRRKKRSLIHCRQGLDRSAAIAAAHLIHYHGLPAQKAIEKTRSLRPRAIGNPGYIGLLRAYELALALPEREKRLILEGECSKQCSEKARITAMLAWSLINTGLAGIHYSLNLLARTLTGKPIDEAARLLEELGREGDKIALIELNPQNSHNYTLKAVLTSYSETAEANIYELAASLARKLAATPTVDVEIEYW